jgi:hypothetical protein
VAAAAKCADLRAAMVQFLIAERADVNKANQKGCAALQRAMCCAVLECAEARLRLATDISGTSSGRYTALHCAAMNGHTDAAVPLLVGGAKQHVKNKDGLIMSGYAARPISKRRSHTIGRSVQANASPRSARIQQARRVRCSVGGGAAAASRARSSCVHATHTTWTTYVATAG